jgi:hypothetical protein
MSLLTFARRNPTEHIQVAEAIGTINRLLERTYPDCTYRVLKAGDFGLASQWVTIELEITRDSLGCLDWYTKQATARGLSLREWKPREAPVLEIDLADSLRRPSFAACLAAILMVSSIGRSMAADQIAYAELNSQYDRIDITADSSDDIGPLSDTLAVGSFAGSDASREYTADSFGSFISIDTSSVETTLIIPQLDIAGPATGMAWDPVAKKMILIADDASCENAVLYKVDLTTGATQSVGAEQGCIKGLAIDSDENAFSIDLTASTLVNFGVGPIGDLGFTLSSVQALFFFSTGSLGLIATDENTGLTGFYTVNTQNGLSTLVGEGQSGYLAFAPAPDPDTILKNGFQANAGFH